MFRILFSKVLDLVDSRSRINYRTTQGWHGVGTSCRWKWRLELHFLEAQRMGSAERRPSWRLLSLCSSPKAVWDSPSWLMTCGVTISTEHWTCRLQKYTISWMCVESMSSRGRSFTKLFEWFFYERIIDFIFGLNSINVVLWRKMIY